MSVFILTLFFGIQAYAVETAAPAAPNWGLDPVQGTLLQPGIVVHTLGTVTPPGTDGTTSDGDHVLKLYDATSVSPTAARPFVGADVHTSHQWDVGSIGNVYGLAIDKNRNIFATASATYGTGYFGGLNQPGDAVNAIVGFGEIGAGTSTELGNTTDGDTPVTNSTAAAGTIYKIDSATGETSVFARLPQQAFSYSNSACEIVDTTIPDLNRNTGPALGNIAYDPVHDQFFVSNFEDGRIYRLDSSGNILNSFDPFTADNGAPGLPSDPRPFGLAVNPEGTALYFGTHELNQTPRLFAVNLDASGNFSGTEIDQNAQYGVDLTATEGPEFSASPHYSYADLAFTPDGKLVVGTRIGCENNFATSYNHRGRYWLLEQDGSGLYNVRSSQVPGGTTAGGSTYDAGTIPTRFINDQYGFDDGYGGIAIYDKGTGDYDYLLTSADVQTEEGPHGFIYFPDTFTTTGGDTAGTYVLEPAAAFTGLPSSSNTGTGADYKGIGGDIEAILTSQLEEEDLTK